MKLEHPREGTQQAPSRVGGGPQDKVDATRRRMHPEFRVVNVKAREYGHASKVEVEDRWGLYAAPGACGRLHSAWYHGSCVRCTSCRMCRVPRTIFFLPIQKSFSVLRPEGDGGRVRDGERKEGGMEREREGVRKMVG